MKSKLLLLVLIIFTASALFSGAADAQVPTKGPKNPKSVPGTASEFGYIPPPVDLSHIVVTPGRLMAPAASWDWRSTSQVTSVKNQNPYGTCWAFGTLGSFEAFILINESIAYDYSEHNIQGCNVVSTDCNAGGNAWMSVNYLALSGTIDESCDTYPGTCPAATCSNPACSFDKQVTEWRVIPNDVTAIKNAVQTYGPLYVSMYASFPGFSSYDGTTCLVYAGTEDPNHAVVIVGWDDDMCGGNGAWIVKNSWGTAWGDNGYFYIEYGSARIGSNANVITDYKNYDPNETIYYFDEYGWWSSVGYGDGNDWGMVAVTPTTSNEYLYSVDFWATAANCSYSIYVYDTFSGGVLSDVLAGPISGTVSDAGYYSIDLPTPLQVTSGDVIYLAADLTTPGYNYPVPYDDTGPMETNKCFVSNDGTSWSALDNGNYAMGDTGIRGRIGPEIVAGECSMEGDPAFFVGFPGGTINVIKGETWCSDIANTNFGFVSTICTEMDTFCMHYGDLLGWTISSADFPEGACFTVNPGSYYWNEVCISVPCDAVIGATNTLTAFMAFCDLNGVCAPDCGDCEDPNWYGGDPYYQTTTQDFEVVESPPALYILQDTLYYVEQGQTAAYIPFSICNGDPCAAATDYGYSIVSLGVVGAAINQNGTAVGVVGGSCQDVYGIIDAGLSDVCDYDTLTIIAWDAATGSVYDTCIQVIHIVEPVPVPLFSTPVIVLLVIAMFLTAAIIMKRRAAESA
ncbi:MAG: hypothetical protein KAV42_06035 [Candidatus Krumholzibacteria bacterium]|nr:hypothetical protein [Candidatus Krumholzibacteria bacterium]